MWADGAEVVAYFSPAVGPVAQELSASPCPQPVRRGLVLLAGNERCWLLLFPDE
jgi:hypothetical protein